MTNINRPILWNTLAGIVTAETTKRGKTLLTVSLFTGNKMNKAGSTIVVSPAAIEFTDEERFTAPTGVVTFGKRDRDYYGDRARMFSRGGE